MSKSNFYSLCKIRSYVFLSILRDLVISHKNNLLAVVTTNHYNYESSSIIYELNGIL